MRGNTKYFELLMFSLEFFSGGEGKQVEDNSPQTVNDRSLSGRPPGRLAAEPLGFDRKTKPPYF